MSVSFCLPHPVAVSAFMICRGLCACTEMLWMCVLYVSFGSKVRPRTFGCVAMGSGLLFRFPLNVRTQTKSSDLIRHNLFITKYVGDTFMYVLNCDVCFLFWEIINSKLLFVYLFK